MKPLLEGYRRAKHRLELVAEMHFNVYYELHLLKHQSLYVLFTKTGQNCAMKTVDDGCGNGSGVFVSVHLRSELSRLFSRSSFYTKQERHDQPADQDVGSLKHTRTNT